MTELNPYQPPESAEADVGGDDHVLERRFWYLCLVGATMLVLGLVLTVGATI